MIDKKNDATREYGYDKFSFARGTEAEIRANIDKLNPYEPAIAIDKDKFIFKTEDGTVKAITIGNDIQAALETKTDKGGYPGTSKDLNDAIITTNTAVNSKLSKTGDTMTGKLETNSTILIETNTPNVGVEFHNTNTKTAYITAIDESGYLTLFRTDGLGNVGDRIATVLSETNRMDFSFGVDCWGTLNARAVGDSKIASRGYSSDFSTSLYSNSGFHVGLNGIPLPVSGTTSTFTKGYQIETVQNDIGYVARSAFGHLRGATPDFGSTVLLFEGDSAGQARKTWEFKHDDGSFNIGGTFATSNPNMVRSYTTQMGLYSSSDLIGFVNRDTSWVFHVDQAGNSSFAGNMSAFSDSKLKKDLEVIPNALDKIKAINGYTYTRKDSGERHAGVVAQEVKEVLPEVVISNKDENGEETLSVAYGNMAGLFIEAIKELKAEVDELKSEIKVLKGKVV